MNKLITDKSFFIAASDYVLSNTARVERFKVSEIMAHFDIKPYNISPADEVLMNHNNYNNLIDFMVSEELIKATANNPLYHELTELGKEVKRLQGYKNYMSYIEKRDSAIIDGVVHAKNTATYTKMDSYCDLRYNSNFNGYKNYGRMLKGNM